MIGVGIFAFEANGGIVIKVGIMREDRDMGEQVSSVESI